MKLVTRTLSRRLGAETLGTFALTFAAGGIDILAEVTHKELGLVARSVCPALVIMAFIFSLGNVSGAHFNPVVTLAFALRSDFPWKWVPGYFLAQICGAILASALLGQLFATDCGAALNQVQMGAQNGFLTELVLTFLLLIVILSTATQHRILGPEAAIPVAATIAGCSLIGIKISGPSMNPVRSLGPMLVFANFENWQIYLFGPLIGAFTAVVVVSLIHQKKPAEIEAACGEG